MLQEAMSDQRGLQPLQHTATSWMLPAVVIMLPVARVHITFAGAPQDICGQ